MDAELKQHLEAMEARFEQMEVRIEQMENRIMERVGGRIDASEERLKDFIRAADQDMETKIIGEFWKWASTSDIRTRQVMDTTRSLNDRLLNAEDRIS